MKSKILVTTTALILTACLVGALFYFQGVLGTKSKLVVQSMDKKGIFVGQTQPALNPASEYAKQVQAVHGAWEYIRLGDSYSEDGRHVEAAEAYKAAYEIGERVMSGFLLAETYEKLGRYEEAISLLNEMIQNLRLNDASLQDAQQMKSRLLAAKNNSSKS